MKKLLAWTALGLFIGASQASAWTLYYDGFAYEPPTAETLAVEYKYDSLAYQLGDPLTYSLFRPTNHPLTYAPSPWIAFNNTVSPGGFMPVIMPYNYSPPAPLPAATGHTIMILGTSNNKKKCVRMSPFEPREIPPAAPFPAVRRGTLYYSLMVKVINCGINLGTPSPGDFYAGFNHEPPDPVVAGQNGKFVTQAAAALRLRPTAGPSFSDSFQIGIQANEANNETSTATVVYHSTGGDPFFGGTGSTPRFVVASYEFRDNEPGPTQDLTNDICRLWIDPDPATFGQAIPPTPSVTTTGGTDATEIRSFFFRHGDSPGGTLDNYLRISRACFDELRIGTTWASVTSTVAPGDFDGDGHADNSDLTAFIECVSGPTIPYAANCEGKDFDFDEDVDQDDFGTFQRCYSGSFASIDPDCALQ